MSPGTEPGYLGVAHRPFTPEGRACPTCAWPAASTSSRQDDRKTLLNGFDDVRRDIDASGTMKGLDAFNARAFDMIASGDGAQGARPATTRSRAAATATRASSSS